MGLLRSVGFLFIMLLMFSTPSSQLALRSAQQPFSPQQRVAPRPGWSQPDTKTRARINESYGKLPLSFEANQGRADNAVKFLSRGNGYQLKLKATEAELELRNADRGSRNKKNDTATRGKGDAENQSAIRNPHSAIVKMQLVNANPTPQMAGRDELPGKNHYYIGNDPKDWRTNVANFAKVEYEQVWPGINLVYYGNQRQLEYDFIVAPGADPKAINLAFEGADKMKIDAQGNLVLHIADGEVVMQKPFVYQEVNGTRQEIAGNYQIRNPNSAICNQKVGFHIGNYDASLPLVIDPVLVYSTYLGPASPDIANDIAVDQAGNVYISGASYFSSEGWNAFVAKLNAAGTALVYSTAFIGGKDEIGFGVAVDAAGNTYATGFTRSTNFPVKNAFQPVGNADNRGNVNDGFITKFSASGTELVYSIYLGGTGIDGCYGIYVTQEQLNFSVKLDDVFPDKDMNNSERRCRRCALSRPNQ